MASLKFLVVDDATFIRDLLKKNLRTNFPGCEVLDEASAKKAQVVLKNNKVDLILCDWEMPEMTGEEFLLWVRSQEEYVQLPFIMVTSRGEKDFIVKAAQAGVSDYLGKPFKPESLVAKVTKALNKVGKSVSSAAVPSVGVNTHPAGGLGILTSGASNGAKPAVKSKPVNDSVSTLTEGAANLSTSSVSTPSGKPVGKTKKTKSAAHGQAQLNFAGFTSQCIIKDITLQTLRGAIKREDNLPAIFDTVVISIVQNDGVDVARLNGYVHGVESGENHIDAGTLKLTIRFVDDDAQKLDLLSRYIATL